MNSLLQLVRQYKSDVEQRIVCIETERDNDEAGWVDPDIVDDYNAQIAHWQATLKGIDEVLAKYDIKSVDIIASGYE